MSLAGRAVLPALFLFLATVGARDLAAQEYSVTDLGTLGGSFSFGVGINESGEVTGDSETETNQLRAFLYRRGTQIDLGTLGPPFGASYGRAVNAAGQVVGDYDDSLSTAGFLYSGAALTALPSLGGGGTAPRDINEAGVIVGFTYNGSSNRRAFRYSGGVMTDLGTLGGDESAASAINNTGQIVGYSDTASGVVHPFLYSGGTMFDLGTIGGSDSFAESISPSGVVVGGYRTGPSTFHAFRHDGTMTDLGTLGGASSGATDINAAGEIVGYSTMATGEFHGFVHRGGVMHDLNDLVPPGFKIGGAQGINEAGQILVNGTVGTNPVNRALLLTPRLLHRIAYAWAHLPTTASYTPDPAYSFNTSGGPISITRQGVGIYDVRFDSLPGWGSALSSAVAVTAYGSSGITCSSVIYSSSATSTVATVACFDTVTRQMADSRFTIMVVGNGSLPAPSAFVMSGGPAPVPLPNPAWSWTSGRLPITVTHDAGPGSYSVLLGTGNTARSAKLVTASSGGGTRCNSAGGISGGLRVLCRDWTGALTDQQFSVVQVAGGLPGRRIGFATADRPTAASYTPNPNASFSSSGGAITATRSAVGRYGMNFAGLQKLLGHTEQVQVTSVGGDVACNVVFWTNSADGLAASVECRNGSGQFVDSRYTVLVIE